MVLKMSPYHWIACANDENFYTTGPTQYASPAVLPNNEDNVSLQNVVF
jgi:hypothetical protein